MMKLSESAMTTEQMLLASIVDNTRILAWMQSEDGVNGTNRPESILAQILGEQKEESTVFFTSGKEFDDEWKRLTGGET